MTAFDLTPAPRNAYLRWLAATLAGFAIVGSFITLHRFFSRKFFSGTGEARWIWVADRSMSSGEPLAFFAVRDVELPQSREFVRIKIAADPQYTLYFNGNEVGGGMMSRTSDLDVWDVSHLANTGHNRLVVALRSSNGVGAFLAAIDLASTRRNLFVTDATWKLFREWRPEILFGQLPRIQMSTPRIVGSPPVGRWNFLEASPKTTEAAGLESMGAVRSFDFIGRLPEIRVLSGIAVASTRETPATAFDFGPVVGRGRIDVQGNRERVIRVRYANDESELSQQGEVVTFVFAKGETSVTEPVTRSFRYMVVYGRGGTATVAVKK